MNSIQAVFLDLDDTLWDFGANAELALNAVWDTVIEEKNVAGNKLDSFKSRYWHHNTDLWTEYREGKRPSSSIRVERFRRTLADLDASDEVLAGHLGDLFLKELYSGKVLVEGAKEVLDYLEGKYELGLITNGFAAGLSRLELCHIKRYFSFVVSSEEFGKPKPHAGIFMHALDAVGVKPEESIYVGDNYEGDVVGARRVGMKAVFFQRGSGAYLDHTIQPDHRIKKLADLKKIL